MRDYSDIHYSSEERRKHYEEVNNSASKKLGDRAEQKVLEYYKRQGIEARLATSFEDAHEHADIILNESTNRTTVDVKCKKEFVLELKNYWGNQGWIYTGADIIVQTFHDSSYWGDDVYVYKREDMVRYINTHKGLFQEKYCDHSDGKGLIWKLGKMRLSEMNFVKKIKI